MTLKGLRALRRGRCLCFCLGLVSLGCRLLIGAACQGPGPTGTSCCVPDAMSVAVANREGQPGLLGSRTRGLPTCSLPGGELRRLTLTMSPLPGPQRSTFLRYRRSPRQASWCPWRPSWS